MLFAKEIQNILIYRNRKVQVTLVNDSQSTGVFDEYNAESSWIKVGGEFIGIEEIKDIEFLGRVTDFHTINNQIGVIDDSVEFGISNITLPDDIESILFQEFDCDVSCHLIEIAGKLSAVDVRIVRKRHVINSDILQKTDCLYYYGNGECVHGFLNILDENTIMVDEHEIGITDIKSISALPQIDDEVVVEMANGNIFRGTVNAINHNAVELFENKKDECVTINLNDFRQIWHSGVVSSRKGKRAIINEKYICKCPYYLNDINDVNLLIPDQRVSFISGINLRGHIAKYVKISEPEAIETISTTEDDPTTNAPIITPSEDGTMMGTIIEEDPTPPKEYYGLIVYIDFSWDGAFGFISDHYVTPAIGRVNGDVRFTRNQVDFQLENNVRAVVKYTLESENTEGIKAVKTMWLVDAIPSSEWTKLAEIRVSPDGVITKIPLFQSKIDLYHHREVDAVCIDGTIVSGTLSNYTEDGITILNGIESKTDTSLRYSEIEDIRIIGTVTQYNYRNGTGYIDGYFFFHVNGMAYAIEASELQRDVQLSFVLKSTITRKGNNLDCSDIRIVPSGRKKVFIVGYDDGFYSVIDEERYGNDIDFLKNTYRIPFLSFNQYSDLDVRDYHAIITLQRKNGTDQCNSIRTIEGRPKLKAGVVTSINYNTNSITIVPKDKYDGFALNQGIDYLITPRSNIGRINRPDSFDYPVLYYTLQAGGSDSAIITWVDFRAATEKRYFGTLNSYVARAVRDERREFGFIKPSRQLSSSSNGQRTENGDVICFPRSFVNPPDRDELLSRTYTYSVCYTLEEIRPNSKFSTPPAKKVWFLGKKERSGQPSPQPQPQPSPSPIVMEDGEIDLTDYLSVNGEKFDGAPWKIGFISVASTRWAIIHEGFINKHQASEANLSFPDSLPTSFDPNNTMILGEISSKFKTAKFTYCVRYVPSETTIVDELSGVEHYYLNPAYPVEVLLPLVKAQYVYALPVDNTTIKCKTIKNVTANHTQTSTHNIADLIEGESVYLEIKDGKGVYDAYLGQSDDVVKLANAGSVQKTAILKTHRFGIITDFAEDDGTAVINGIASFDLHLLDKASLNVLKNQRTVHLHVSYCLENGVITEVVVITNVVGRDNPVIDGFVWTRGSVTAIDKEKREITLSSGAIHCISVRTEPLVSAMFRDGTIADCEVLSREVRHPFVYEGSEETELVISAIDVRCVNETATVRFNAAANQFFGHRNDTIKYPVFGIAVSDSNYENSTQNIEWITDENGIQIKAVIKGTLGETVQADEPEEDVFVARGIREHPVFRLWYDSFDLRSIHILNENSRITLDEDGMPADISQAESAIKILSKQCLERRGSGANRVLNMALAFLALKYDQISIPGLPDRDEWINKIIRNWFIKIASDADIINLSFGESNYALAALISNQEHNVDSRKRYSWAGCLYRLFASAFLERDEIIEVYNLHGKLPREKSWDELLVSKEIVDDEHMREFVSQLLLLDNASLDDVAIAVEKNLQLSNGLKNYIEKHGLTTGSNLDAVHMLQEKYRGYRYAFVSRIHELVNSSGNDFIKKLLLWLNEMQPSFSFMLCATDLNRFEKLRTLCNRISRYRMLPGFSQQSRELNDIERDLLSLTETIKTHPCHDSFELFVAPSDNRTRKGILACLLAEARQQIRALLQFSKPSIEVTPIEQEISVTERALQLFISNNYRNRESCQPARDLRVELESLTEGVSIENCSLESNILDSGESIETETLLYLVTSSKPIQNIKISVHWIASYSYDIVDDTGRRTIEGTNEDVFDVQIADSSFCKNQDAANPYQKPAQGDPLDAGDEMFVGRKDVLARIRNTIMTKDNQGRQCFIPGSTVILYGERKAGKTSLVNVLLDELVRVENAIVISFTDLARVIGEIKDLNSFIAQHYYCILAAFESAVNRYHPHLWDEMEEAGIKHISTNDLIFMSDDRIIRAFRAFFTQFREWDKGKHAIVIISDEYSRIPVRILELKELDPIEFTRKQLKEIPSFVRVFSKEYGFVQIFIGHESMISSLRELGTWNHTAEFAERIKLAELADDEAKELIVLPMKRIFGYDPYSLEICKDAIREICDLTGNKPVYLMRLCSYVYEEFRNSSYRHITKKLVETAADRLVSDLEVSLFDILLAEDNDDTCIPEDRDTYRFLESAARCAINAGRRSASADDVDLAIRTKYGDGFNCSEVRDLLDRRGVISFKNSVIAIKPRLFVEYIRKRRM